MKRSNHFTKQIEGVANDMMPVLLPPKMDFIFKKIFGNEKKPEILISFLNAVLTPKDPISSVTLKDRSLDKAHQKDKNGLLDVLAQTKEGHLINIEIQVKYEKEMIGRSLYYWSRLFGSQLDSGHPYENLSRTICINILDFNILESEHYHNCYVLKERDRNEELTDLLELHFIELKKLKQADHIDEIKNPLEAWLEFISHPESQVSFDLAHQNEQIREAKDELVLLSCDEQARLFYEGWLKMHLDYISYTSRIKTAQDEALKEGIEAGRKQSAIDIAKNLLDILDDNTISLKTGLSIDEVQQIRKESATV